MKCRGEWICALLDGFPAPGRATTATSGEADCAQQIRIRGAVYTSYGYSHQDATKYATADQAECRDVGPDAAGSVFPEHPRRVTAWTFETYRPGHVLGVRFDKDSFAVFVANSFQRARGSASFKSSTHPTP